MIQSSTQRNIVGIAAAAVVACSGMASADVVRVSTEGVIDTVSQFGTLQVGDSFSFWFDVDLSMSADSNPNPFNGSFDGAVVGFEASAGSFTVTGSGPGTMKIEHLAAGGEFDVDAARVDLNSNEHFSHEFIRSIHLELLHYGSDFFSSDNLDEVLGLGDISVWDTIRSFSMVGSTPDRGAGGEITSISVTTIPAPSSLAMLGCFGAVATRRRR